MQQFLNSRRPTVLRKVNQLKESFGGAYQLVGGNSENDETVIPPLNTDIRFVGMLPEHNLSYASGSDFHDKHPHKPHVHKEYEENFSWHIISNEDDSETIAKKKLIHPVQNQHMCGSCWAMCAASVMSDCFVVGGTVTWRPSISPTYIMMCLPSAAGNGQCGGGNPAQVVVELEKTYIADTSCIDYSWCSNDSELCTSASAAQHFKSTFTSQLNANIPKKCGCYFSGERYMYKIDEDSNVYSISDDLPANLFRSTVKASILDFGPVMGGLAVQRNFVTGNFTDPKINQGVYLDRCDYSTPGTLTFDDIHASESELNGLHAIAVVGWGLAKNIQYDTNKFGDVPFWWCRNSWGEKWGNMKGYFKIAMYPFNKWAQIGKTIHVKGSWIGGVILVRATYPPIIKMLPQIDEKSLSHIKRTKPDNFYQKMPHHTMFAEEDLMFPIEIVLGVAIVLFAIWIWKRKYNNTHRFV